MKNFERDNKHLSSAMETHLIEDLLGFGIWDDDYDAFFEKRAAIVSRKLQERIIPQEIDKQLLLSLPDEETEESDEVLEDDQAEAMVAN